MDSLITSIKLANTINNILIIIDINPGNISPLYTIATSIIYVT